MAKKEKSAIALPPNGKDIPYQDEALDQIADHDQAQDYLQRIQRHLSDEEISLMNALILNNGNYNDYAQAHHIKPVTLRSKISRLRKKCKQLGRDWKK